MAKQRKPQGRKFTKKDLSFNFGANVKKAKGKPTNVRTWKGISFGS